MAAAAAVAVAVAAEMSVRGAKTDGCLRGPIEIVHRWAQVNIEISPFSSKDAVLSVASMRRYPTDRFRHIEIILSHISSKRDDIKIRFL